MQEPFYVFLLLLRASASFQATAAPLPGFRDN